MKMTQKKETIRKTTTKVVPVNHPVLTSLSFKELENYAESEYRAGKAILDKRTRVSDDEFTNGIEHMKMAAIMGYPSAAYELAEAYIHPFMKDEKKNLEEGVLWLGRAAEEGNAKAQEFLGKIYQYGWYGTKVNKEMAFGWYSKSAKQGNADSCLSLGYMYYHGNEIVDQDYSKAMNYFIQADKSGDGFTAASAAETIAEMYLNGYGVPVCGVDAARWYRKSALRGVATSAFLLGELYFHGIAGVEKDSWEAFRWYEMAATMVCPCMRAKLQLAICVRPERLFQWI